MMCRYVQINLGILPFCPAAGKEFCRVGYYVMLGVKISQKTFRSQNIGDQLPRSATKSDNFTHFLLPGDMSTMMKSFRQRYPLRMGGWDGHLSSSNDLQENPPETVDWDHVHRVPGFSGEIFVSDENWRH